MVCSRVMGGDAEAKRWYWALAALALLPFLNALSNGFVAGDLQFLINNDAVREPGLLRAAFAHGYWYTGDGTEGNMYRPITVLSNGLELRLWGQHPLPFHLTNIALHVGCTLLSASCFSRICPGRPRVTWCAAALFALHPVHVHAVTYIQGRTDLLCAIAYLGALRCALSARGLSPWSVTGAVALYALSLLSKESGITWLPVVAACLWVTHHQASKGSARPFWSSSAIAGLVATLLVTAAYFALRDSVLGTTLSHRRPNWETLGVGPWLLTCAKIYAFYLRALLWPVRHDFLPPFLPVFELTDATGWASLLVTLLWAALTAGLGHLTRLARAMLLWLAVTFSPVCGVVPLGYWVKENYAYLPSVAFCLLVSLGVAAFWSRASATLGGPPLRDALWKPLLALFAVTCIALTWVRNQRWHDSQTFLEHIIAVEDEIPDGAFQHPAMLGSAYEYGIVRLNYGLTFGKERCVLALPHYARAAQLLVGSGGPQAEMLMADCYARHGRVAQAEAIWKAALAASHRYSGIAAENLAMLWAQRGNLARANGYRRRACELGRSAACRAEDAPGPAPTPPESTRLQPGAQ